MRPWLCRWKKRHDGSLALHRDGFDSRFWQRMLLHVAKSVRSVRTADVLLLAALPAVLAPHHLGRLLQRVRPEPL